MPAAQIIRAVFPAVRKGIHPLAGAPRIPNVVPMPRRGGLASTRRRVPDEPCPLHDDPAAHCAGAGAPAMMSALTLSEDRWSLELEPPLAEPDGDAGDDHIEPASDPTAAAQTRSAPAADDEAMQAWTR